MKIFKWNFLIILEPYARRLARTVLLEVDTRNYLPNIYASNGEYVKALEYYHQALELNSKLPQALNNIAVIYHYQGVKASKKNNFETAKVMFDKAAEYWKQAVQLAPNNYIEAQNWLKTTGRLTS